MKVRSVRREGVQVRSVRREGVQVGSVGKEGVQVRSARMAGVHRRIETTIVHLKIASFQVIVVGVSFLYVCLFLLLFSLVCFGWLVCWFGLVLVFLFLVVFFRFCFFLFCAVFVVAVVCFF